MTKIKSKKAQMEILGLAIIVVLIILGVLFGIMVLRKKAPELRQEFEQKTLAVNYINTLLGTTTDCYKVTFRELIQDCAQGGSMQCSEGNSCIYTRTKFIEILQQTLTKRKQDYVLTLTGPGDVNTITQGSLQKCTGEVKPGIQYIPTSSGTVTIKLDLCT